MNIDLYSHIKCNHRYSCIIYDIRSFLLIKISEKPVNSITNVREAQQNSNNKLSHVLQIQPKKGLELVFFGSKMFWIFFHSGSIFNRICQNNSTYYNVNLTKSQETMSNVPCNFWRDIKNCFLIHPVGKAWECKHKRWQSSRVPGSIPIGDKLFA